MSTTSTLREAITRIRGHRFLVVGDLYLDSYIFGQPSRVSREAPIMVLEETRREERPGGGSAPALALAMLGADVRQAGIIGDDPEGQRLLSLLGDAAIDTDAVLTDPDRPTTVKTRIVAEGAYNVFPQQVSRIDRQDRTPINGRLSRELAEMIQRCGSDVDGVILSDYRSGVVTPDVIGTVREQASLGTVDSQGSLRDFAGLDLIKCNQAEAERVLEADLSRRETRRDQLSALQRELGTSRLIVTLGSEGAAISSTSLGYREVPPLVHQQVFDVTGAGDTVIAVLTAAIAAGADDLTALHLSQIAAGLVIAKWGNAQASLTEILEAIGDHEALLDPARPGLHDQE